MKEKKNVSFIVVTKEITYLGLNLINIQINVKETIINIPDTKIDLNK